MISRFFDSLPFKSYNIRCNQIGYNLSINYMFHVQKKKI